MKILCDTREQAPYTFDRYQGVAVERASLQTCDYSLAGLHDHIGLERKSLDDLTGTLTKGRERFQRECERGRGLDYFGLIIEASLEARLPLSNDASEPFTDACGLFRPVRAACPLVREPGGRGVHDPFPPPKVPRGTGRQA
uniref:ERCC4 domain-containing protein n=1 Tax=uncultured Bilophila sp. TaxID=529385 RepID=UPI0025DE7A0D|nr:ERCC4 domain-containing protein [uncultured Bilophila sp.]